MKTIGILVAAAAFATAGCSKGAWEKATAADVNPEFHDVTDIPPGPGAFTGKKGYWELEPPLDIFEAETKDPNEVRKVRRKN